jgi:general secretion pathway protein F
MKTFEYKGYDAQGRTCRGLIEAFNSKDAGEKLAARSIYTVSLNEAAGGKRSLRRRRSGPSSAERATLYREMSALLKAGLPLARTFELLIDTPELGANRTLLAGIRDRVRQGDSLADAFSRSGLTVLPFETAIVEIGERSGALGSMLERLAEYLEEQGRLHERVQTALIYPAFVMIMSILIMILMLGVMLPRFAVMFEETGVALPALTRAVLAGGRIAGFLIVLLPMAGILWGIAWRRYLCHRESAAVRMDRFWFRVPLIARGYTALVNIRFARTLALLLDGGVSLLEAMVYAGRATNSAWIKQLIIKKADQVRHGSTLADALRGVPPLAGALPGWVQAGEAGGDLAAMLEQSASRYQQQWDRLIARFLAVLEPVLILVIGGCVLLIALAVLMPVMSLNQALGS